MHNEYKGLPNTFVKYGVQPELSYKLKIFVIIADKDICTYKLTLHYEKAF